MQDLVQSADMVYAAAMTSALQYSQSDALQRHDFVI